MEHRDVIILPLSGNCVVDTSKLKGLSTFVMEGTVIGSSGEFVPFPDQQCEILDSLQVKIDGKGADNNSNIGFKGNFCIPYIRLGESIK